METEIESIGRHIVVYFKPTVLAQYRAERQKFHLEVADFEGRVELEPKYSCTLDNVQRKAEGIYIRFGFRRHKSGEYYLAVFAYDFKQYSAGHVERWFAYRVDADEMSAPPDTRFESWEKRYLHGSWDVENNVVERLLERVRTINALTTEAFTDPLFLHEANPQLHAPIAENTHAYQDAHKELYSLLIDGLDKGVVENLTKRMKVVTSKTDKYTVKRLKLCFPALTGLWTSLELVSLERGKASHSVRPPAESFPAFEAFCDDLEKIVEGLRSLQTELENLLGATGEDAVNRQGKVRAIPASAGPPADAALMCVIPDLNKMVGRTVESVTLSQRRDEPDAHRSELLQISFTDGSVIYIDTGTNACNVADDHGRFDASEFDVYFLPHFVPRPTTK